jgi:hypothetical protein
MERQSCSTISLGIDELVQKIWRRMNGHKKLEAHQICIRVLLEKEKMDML